MVEAEASRKANGRVTTHLWMDSLERQANEQMTELVDVKPVEIRKPRCEAQLQVRILLCSQLSNSIVIVIRFRLRQMMRDVDSAFIF